MPVFKLKSTIAVEGNVVLTRAQCDGDLNKKIMAKAQDGVWTMLLSKLKHAMGFGNIVERPAVKKEKIPSHLKHILT